MWLQMEGVWFHSCGRFRPQSVGRKAVEVVGEE